MDANFTGPSYTLGVEEELMILDGETLALANEIDAVVDAYEGEGEVKPELLQSVLEIATPPCKDLAEAGHHVRRLRREVSEAAAARGLAIGSAGTHPFALWEDQRVSADPRYRELIAALRFIARQEIIFGLHVHVGIDDPEKAIHVANGMRVHVPILLALSANSPYWRSDQTGLASTRMPIFRAFPRVGIPPHYENWSDYENRISFMVDAGVMADHTFLWYDVRPHPKFGTVEVRAMDAQTHVEHTLALTALIQAMVKELAEHSRRASSSAPIRTRCSTRTSGSPRATGSRASSSTCQSAGWCRARSWRAGSTTGCASTPRTSAARPSSRAYSTCSTRAPARPASASSTRRTTTGWSCSKRS